MGLGSLETSPFLDLGFRMMTSEANSGQAEEEGKQEEDGTPGGDASGRDCPPAEKYPRRSSASPPERRTQGAAREGATKRRTATKDCSPLTKVDLHNVSERRASVEDVRDASDGSGEGSNLDVEIKEEAGGSDGGGSNHSDGSKGDDDQQSFCFSFPHLSSASFLGAAGCAGHGRKQRAFVPDNRKDDTYWEKRRKNNEAARKSREKRRLHDLLLENRIVDLEQTNSRLRQELTSLKRRYGIPLDAVFTDPRQDAGSPPDLVTNDPPPSSSASPPGLVVVTTTRGGGRAAGDDDELGVPPRLSPVHDPPVPHHLPSHPPPPLLAVSMGGAVPVQPVFPGQVPPPTSSFSTLSSSSLPFLVSAVPADLSVAHPAFPVVIPPAHQHGPVVKRECVEEDVDLQTSYLRRDLCPEEGPMSDFLGDLYPRYAASAASSPQGCAGPPPAPLLAPPALVAAAHCRWWESSPSLGQGVLDVQQLPAHCWHRSPLSSHSSEDLSEEPLQLTVHRRGSGAGSPPPLLPGDLGSSGDGAEVKGGGQCSGSSPPHSSLPVKLRYKIGSDPSSLLSQGAVSCTAVGEGRRRRVTTTTTTTPPLQLAVSQQHVHMSDTAFPQDCPLPLIKKEPAACGFHTDCPHSSGYTNHLADDPEHHHDPHHHPDPDPKSADLKYRERRRRNNEAARKCRENRRNLTRLREAQSDQLQSENSQLRQELGSLQEEMRQLRDLLDHRQGDQGAEASLQDAALSVQRRQQLLRLEEEYRLLKREQGRLGRRRGTRQGQKQRGRHGVVGDEAVDLNNDDTEDDHRETN
ncbi:uncharacterized protein LOC143294924 [Babylonia areolata]|uniref:uncharacterized protein LOC143294924 n=1 Tax=Babylonia areolata TaxID=304850 RepID=UPI003FD1523C